MKAKDTFVKQLSRSMTKELVKTHLDLEAWHLRTETLDEETLHNQTYLVLFQQVIICIADKSVSFGASIAGAENISKTHILEALILEVC